MTRAELLALAERIEAAPGPDRALDVEIALACGVVRERDGNVFYGHKQHSVVVLERDYYDREGDAPELEHFTASTDATSALVKPWWLYMVRELWDGLRKAGYATITMYADDPRMFVTERAAVAATPALAMNSAVLKAMAEEAA